MLSELRTFIMALAALVIILFPSDAKPWPIKRFEVVALEPAGTADLPGSSEKHVVALVRVLRENGFDPDKLPDFNSVQLDPGSKYAMEQFLADTALLYEQWGFPAPRLEPIVDLPNGDKAYRIYLVDHLDNMSGLHRYACMKTSTERVILIDATDVLIDVPLDGDPSAKPTAFTYAVLAHELFHAVQGGTAFMDPCSDMGTQVGDWIVEGMADAVAWDAVRRLRTAEPTNLNVVQASASQKWGIRDYTQSLSVPSLENPQPVAYRTSSFWRYLAEMRSGGTPGVAPQSVDYSFLVNLLSTHPVTRDCNTTSEAECDAEFYWLDRNLRQEFGKPLREIFSLFMQAYVGYDEGRINKSKMNYIGDMLPRCPSAIFNRTDDPENFRNANDIQKLVLKKFEDNAAACINISPLGYEGDVRIRVRVDDLNKRFAIENLTAGIEGPPFEADKAKVHNLREDGGARMASWEFVVSPEESTQLLLTNVADNPAKTATLDGLPVTIQVIEEYAKMAEGSLSGGSTPMPDIGSPVNIELDRIRQKNIVRAQTETNQNAGFLEPCLIRFDMENSQSGAGLALVMDHDGPVLPGSYEVAYLDTGHFEAPEKNPGQFVVKFSLGEMGQMVDGKLVSYGAQSGDVEITTFAPDLVQGSVRVTGVKETRGYMSKPVASEYDAAPVSLNVEVAFSFVPRVLPGGALVKKNDHCFVPDSSRWTRAIASSPPPSVPPETSDDKQGEDQTRRPDRPTDSTEENEGGQDNPAGETSNPTAGSSSGSRGHIEDACRPLYFTGTRPFTSNPALPFQFDIPAGWNDKLLDGPRFGEISSPDYPGGGIGYNIRWLSTPSDVAQNKAFQEAMWKVIGTVDFRGEAISVYSGQIGDTLNTYVTLPTDDRNLAVELLFKGRRGCEMNPVEDLRALFMESFRAVN